ncbi:outer membrane protein assembly factor BamB family protein [Gemmata sp.]|uniref:PQQ-like beta-propeller repeat protein n=1 Tax=Gemmata sp. TaxID=1914242 RepID=UPI003F713104
MPRAALALCFALALALPVAAAEWVQFRGAAGDGHADAAKLPTEWDQTKNVAWRVELPGNGWSSPVAAGGKVYVTTAVPGEGKGDYSLRALCLDAKTGKTLWDAEVFKEDGKTAAKIHSKNSHASPTPVLDGEFLFVHFGHLGTACLKANDGSKVWTQEALKYTPVHGAGGSPVLAADKLIFCIDGVEKQAVIALDRKTGKVAWQTPRDAKPKKPFSFATPLLIAVGGKEQVVAQGSDVVMALDPKTGTEIWRVKYNGYSVVPKPLFANGTVYLSTGYDNPVFYAIRADGTGDVTDTHVAWTVKKGVPRNASPLLVGDAIYMAADDGTLTCIDAKTGAERWNERVGKAYSSSPVFANGHVYLLAEDGTATVFKPGSSYDPVATNKMGERALASYGVDGDALLLRTEKALYRIERK